MTPEQKMWRAVLCRAKLDADGLATDLRTEERGLVKKQAISWFGSKDHREVCGLAGIDHDKIKPEGGKQ